MRLLISALCACVGLAACVQTAGSPAPGVSMLNASPERPTRADLYGALDAYLAALAAHDPARAQWADVVFNTENNVAMPIGEGVWNTVSELGGYDLRFADVETGQVGMFGSLYETSDLERPFAVRLGVEDGAIAEVELVVYRVEDTALPFGAPVFPDKPKLNEVIPAEERLPRERLISIADGYFDTLQLNDGQLFTAFAPDCNRFENGFQTTNNHDQELSPVLRLGCEAQFRLGAFRYDDRLRARRYPLVDEERGLVLAAAFIDHSGREREIEMTNGEIRRSSYWRPHSYYLLELFKIRDGAIEQVEANFITVPYYMPSPWDE